MAPTPKSHDKKAVVRSHRRVADALGKVATQTLQLIPSHGIDNDWWRAAPGRVLGFILHPSRNAPVFATRRTGERVPVFPLAPADATPKRLVFSYSERWTCVRQGQFAPYDASILAAAMSMRGALEEIVRADWDARLDGASRGQPHWHTLTDPSHEQIEGGQVAPPDADVARAADGEERRHLLGGVHLPMGGWENKNRPPAVWRCVLDLESLPAWADAVVRHLAEELGDTRYLRWAVRN